ncbi:hypothetical protein CPB85DRAFT_1247149 [Mucidula mucida]|nr:hypothetical protein CPB85DRAFT_1247149 [Mucidula mucida]
MRGTAIFLTCATLIIGAPAHLARSGTHLTQAQVEAFFEPQGIAAFSTGGCTDKMIPTCTSYGLLPGTANGVITLKNAAGASSLVITGGTEVGHARERSLTPTGTRVSVDVRHATIVDNYITNTFTRIADRSDGFPQWEAASGNIYCDEGSHWDITYF